MRQIVPCLVVFSCLMLPVFCKKKSFGQFDSGSDFAKRLASPITSVLDEVPFRLSLERISTPAQINLWIDREIDPSSNISPGSVGPTVYEALVKIATERACVVLAIENVVLVGTPDRVDSIADVLMTMSDRTAASGRNKVDVRWARLTTPTEALTAVLGSDLDPLVVPPLPHDLWPATTWNAIDRRVAVSLVLAQFGRQMASFDLPTNLPVVELATQPLLSESIQLPYLYKIDSVPPAARQATTRSDVKARFNPSVGQMLVTTTPTGHRMFVDALLRSFPGVAAKPQLAQANAMEALRKDTRRFTFRLVNKPAREVLQSLAATANVRLEFEPTVDAESRALISLEAVDVSLVDLLQQVAKEANLQLVFKADLIRVTP